MSLSIADRSDAICAEITSIHRSIRIIQSMDIHISDIQEKIDPLNVRLKVLEEELLLLADLAIHNLNSTLENSK